MSKEFGFDVPTVITTRAFYAPRKQDAPRSYERKFSYYGESRDELVKLAQELNASKPVGPIFMLGSARAIDARLKTGQCFVVSRLLDRAGNTLLTSPSELRFLPQANMILFEDRELNTKEKCLFYAEQSASLLELDFQYFWNALNEEIKPQVILIRSVTEEASEKLDPYDADRSNWAQMMSQRNLLGFPLRAMAYQRYQTEITDLFERMMRTNALVESIDPASIVIPKRAK